MIKLTEVEQSNSIFINIEKILFIKESHYGTHIEIGHTCIDVEEKLEDVLKLINKNNKIL